MSMLTIAVLALLGSAYDSQDLSKAYYVMDRLQVYELSARPSFRHYSEDQIPYIQKNFTFSDRSVSLRADDSLFAYWWSPDKETARQRRNQPQSVPDSTLLASAKTYVGRLWPNQHFVFRDPYEGADSEAPSRMINFRAALNGIEVDEDLSGLVIMDSIGGELRMMRSPDTPKAPVSLERSLDESQANAILLGHIAAKYRPQTMLWIALPTDLRIYAPDRDAYQKASRLVYRISVYEVVSDQPGKPDWYGRWIRCKIDPVSGEIVSDRAAGFGGKVAFDQPLPSIQAMKFDVVVWGKSSRKSAKGAAIEQLAKVDKEPSLTRSVPLTLAARTYAVAATYDLNSKGLFLKYVDGWYKATPNKQLATALQQVER